MRSALVPLAAAAAQRRANRARSNSLSAVPPAETSEDYLPELAEVAASILYRSPLPSREGLQIYILNAAAFPDAYEFDYDSLLSYVLARLPGEDELISGREYEIIFFSGGTLDNATAEKKQGPSTGWYLQAYHVLSRATRKKLKKLYIVHPRSWVRMLIIIFGRIVSPKFGKKIEFINSLTNLAQHVEMEQLLIPPSAYLQDRRISPDIYVPFVTGTRAFGARHAFPLDTIGTSRLPRVLRETTSFLLMPNNVVIEGLFRIPPHSIQLGLLKEAYDRGQHYIIWKERGAALALPSIDGSAIDEIRSEDAYGVHLAASLIKAWYRDLLEPIFPESCYAQLHERYRDPHSAVSLEDLTDLLLAASHISPLSVSSREILTRHLLPMLSQVASYEAQNKMNAENLAICFSMCLVCGSNQMEDGRISVVIRRILQAAIQAWPQLCTGMGLDPNALQLDLAAPKDHKSYEDPLEDDRPKRVGESCVQRSRHEHRAIVPEIPNADLSSFISQNAFTHRPQQPSAASDKDSMQPKIEKPHHDLLPSLPKRKLVPTVADSTSDALSHPADSDSDEKGMHSAELAIITPSPGRTEQSRMHVDSRDSVSGGEKPIALVRPSEVYPTVWVPKRKAVSSSYKPEDVTTNQTLKTVSPVHHTAFLARIAAQQAAAQLTQRGEANPPNRHLHEDTNTTHSAPVSVHTSTNTSCLDSAPEGDLSNQRLVWSAATTRQTPSNIHSLSKPVHGSKIPLVTRSPPENLSVAPVPRHRAPSPGLLKRMESMENTHQQFGDFPSAAHRRALEPRRLNLEKASVDDLRRLYEERATTANNLESAVRRGSAASGFSA